jgi:hypothetical protein
MVESSGEDNQGWNISLIYPQGTKKNIDDVLSEYL